MSDLWMSGVTRYDTGRRLSMGGQYGARLFTWHTFEAPYSYSPDLRAAVRYLSAQRSDPHFVFHPITGALVQMLPANTGGRTLRAPGVSTNTWGAVHMQVEVIAYASRPWTRDLTVEGKETLARLMDYLRSWGVPDRWCHGVRPPRYPGGSVRRIQPTQSGHFHHAGWRGNDHGDPGAIRSPWTLVGTGAPAPDPTPPGGLTVSDVNKILDVLDDIRNVNVSEGTAANLYTGRTGNQPLGWFLNLIGNRVGRTDQRVNDLAAEVAGIREAVMQIGEVSGMDRAQVESIVNRSIEGARVRLEAGK